MIYFHLYLKKNIARDYDLQMTKAIYLLHTEAATRTRRERRPSARHHHSPADNNKDFLDIRE